MNKRIWKNRAAAACLLCTATVMAASAQTFTTLVVFNAANGGSPGYMSLIVGKDGKLYGTTVAGGSSGLGTVFKMTAAGRLTTANALDGTAGANPLGGMVQATDGNFYGLTSQGGANGWGTVFKMTARGTVTDLHDFNNNTDGGEAFSNLIQGKDGNLYGTNLLGPNGQGTIFKITTRGRLTTLHALRKVDGGEPFGGLIQATDGNFYGTTSTGVFGNGTIFRMSATGTFKTMHAFKADGSDGASPYAGLVQGTDGNFYGTTFMGGTNNLGTVFKMTPAGKLTTLYSFTGMGVDGANPTSQLIQGADGNFYGTTHGGGLNGDGSIFQMTPSGVVMTLHSFDGTDGSGPYGGLVQDPNGAFYGTTNSGTIDEVGSVFKLKL